MEISRRFSGSATATGNITLKQSPVGFYTDSGATDVFTGGMWYKTADISLGGGAATVKVQGCVGDPSVTGNWYDISSISADGTVGWAAQDDFTRINVSAYTSGTVKVRLSASGI